MEATYTQLEKNYNIQQRVQDRIKEHGSVEKALSYCEAELKECEAIWSDCSYDCVGHAMTCNRLLINRLKEIQNNNSLNI